jgi:hypothetical protein
MIVALLLIMVFDWAAACQAGSWWSLHAHVVWQLFPFCGSNAACDMQQLLQQA